MHTPTSVFHQRTPSFMTAIRLGIVLFFFLGACSRPLPLVRVEPFPEQEALFQRSEGWTGGDGVFSVGLDSERILWLFGDTFIGKVVEGRHVDADLVNNTLALQKGKIPGQTEIEFFYRQKEDRKPIAVFLPPDGLGWFWPYHGLRRPEGLYLFLIQVERSPGPVGFDFKTVASWLARVKHPDRSPRDWEMEMKKIPWSEEGRIFGSAVLEYQGDCLIYGVRDKKIGGWTQKQIILARAPTERLMDFSAWRFYAKGEWVAAVERAEAVCDQGANEFSVSYLPALKKFILLYTRDSLSEDIVFRSADQPHGPWGDPVGVFRCPEARWDERIFCYAAKGHPELSLSPEELVVSYTTNSTDFQLIVSDSRFYRPRFLRLRFFLPGSKRFFVDNGS